MLDPVHIFRSITSDLISIAAIPTRSLVVHTRARLRLISRLEPLCGTSANDHTHAPSSERNDIARSGSKISIRIPLDPVICVRAATTNAPLHEPRPDRRGRDADRDRLRSHHLGVVEYSSPGIGRATSSGVAPAVAGS
jgi:hypothetical protein